VALPHAAEVRRIADSLVLIAASAQRLQSVGIVSASFGPRHDVIDSEGPFVVRRPADLQRPAARLNVL
jgi:hypothetical protein